MLVYLGWILAAFLLGFLIALFCIRRRSLRAHFANVDNFRGREYKEILAAAGREPDESIRRPDGRSVYTWQDRDYAISLLYDGSGLGLGVEDDRMVRK